jgi:hypothetical protein
MSSRNNKQQQPVKKPFCKVCQDAGKSESEYTNHYVRSMPDRNGKTTVTCPTLLATECRYCFELGHTTKFCPVIAVNKKEEVRKVEQAKRKEAEEKKPAKSVATKPKNVFAALDISSDSEEEKPVVAKVTKNETKKVAIKGEFPALCASTISAPVMSGWASVAAKTAEQYENEKYEQQLIANSMKRQMPPMKTVVSVPQVKQIWEDYDSGDDYEVAYLEAAAAVKITKKASELNWAMSDDSDEDW